MTILALAAPTLAFLFAAVALLTPPAPRQHLDISAPSAPDPTSEAAPPRTPKVFSASSSASQRLSGEVPPTNQELPA